MAAMLILAFTTLVLAQSSAPEPPAPMVTDSPTLDNATICVDNVNDCGEWYGGCYSICDDCSTPTFTPPPCPSTTESTTTAAPSSTITLAPSLIWPQASPGNGSCQQVMCIDYLNNCDIKYGGCFPICEGYTTPVFIDPGCPTGSFSSYSKSFVTTRTTSCGYKCDDYVDGCGNTFGPGCYTSCVGVAPPSYTTPYCETSVAMTEAVVTAVPTNAMEDS